MTEPEVDLFDDGGLSGPASEAVRRIATAGFHALWRGRTLTLAELVGDESAALTEAAVSPSFARAQTVGLTLGEIREIVAFGHGARRLAPTSSPSSPTARPN